MSLSFRGFLTLRFAFKWKAWQKIAQKNIIRSFDLLLVFLLWANDVYLLVKTDVHDMLCVVDPEDWVLNIPQDHLGPVGLLTNTPQAPDSGPGTSWRQEQHGYEQSVHGKHLFGSNLQDDDFWNCLRVICVRGTSSNQVSTEGMHL